VHSAFTERIVAGGIATRSSPPAPRGHPPGFRATPIIFPTGGGTSEPFFSVTSTHRFLGDVPRVADDRSATTAASDALSVAHDVGASSGMRTRR
jgi:hypothetical protein